MKNISQINLFVHPDYHGIKYCGNDRYFLHPLQQGIRDTWNPRIQEVAEREDAILVYISALKKDEIHLLSNDLIGIKRDDLDRISECKRLLGRRFVLFPFDVAVTDKSFSKQLRKNRLRLNYGNLELITFGEYTEHCVNRETEDLQDVLRIPDENVTLNIRLSLSRSDIVFYEQERNHSRGLERL